MFLGLKWILMQTAMQLLGGTHAESTPLLPTWPCLAHHPPLSSERILPEIRQRSQALDRMAV
jgi:hypothetical protein